MFTGVEEVPIPNPVHRASVDKTITLEKNEESCDTGSEQIKSE